MKNSGKLDVLSSEELLSAIESDETEHYFKRSASLLFDAINDWPKLNLQEPIELIEELKQEIGSPLSYANIANYYTKLNVVQDAWKKEALSSILEMFDFERKSEYDFNVNLEEIIVRITNHYRQ